MLLGGGHKDSKRKSGTALVEEALVENSKIPPAGFPSIFTYCTEVARLMHFNQNFVVNLEEYLICPSEYNKNIPKNMKLLLGSQNLAIINNELTRLAHTHGMHWTQDLQWKNIHLCLRNSLSGLAAIKSICTLIDTNPSFATFTAIGVAAADRIICPVKSDDSSRVALCNMLALIYGPSQLQISFAAQACRQKLQLPKIFICVANQLKKGKKDSAKAFSSMVSLCSSTLREIALQHPEYFQHGACSTIKDFRSRHFRELHDLNTRGVVAAHKGIPLGQLGNSQIVGGTRINLDRRFGDQFPLKEISTITDIM